MTVTAPQGFVAAGVHAKIRKEKRDLALVRSLAPATGAAMWTQNRVLAAPVVVSKQHLELAQPQAVVVNSGIANAATGEQGLADAIATAEHAASLLGLQPEQVIVLSTGVIGAPLPMDRILAGLDAAAAALTADGGADAAEAILTTDTRPKTAVSHGAGFTVGGMAKGSGMIHPNLATMLAVVTTDYPLEPGEAIEFLQPTVERQLQRDHRRRRVLDQRRGRAALLRRRARSSEHLRPTPRSPPLSAPSAPSSRTRSSPTAKARRCSPRSRSRGAASDDEAKAIAQRIATSPLVKTALFGRDANWGRVLMAAGSAPFNGGYAQLDPALVSLAYNGTAVLVAGAPQNVEPPVDGATCTIDLDLGLGNGRPAYLTSDLSYDYVRINAEYRS